MEEQPTFHDDLRGQVLCWSLSPITLYGLLVRKPTYDKLERQDHDKPKDQGEELIEMNLATLKGESQPISANPQVKLRKVLLHLLQELKDIFGLNLHPDARARLTVG